jgi:hypothetical protein
MRPALAFFALLGFAAGIQEPTGVGYDDTPVLPGQEWRVHDKRRPAPPVVEPGEAGAPPADAIVLFDGGGLEAWQHADGRDAEWIVGGGAMTVKAGSGSLRTRADFGSCQLHVEWRTPDPPQNESQMRGNSGVFLMGLYEVQVLDSWRNVTYADGQAAAIYGQQPPLVNACRPPGAWQSYDVFFRAPRFGDDGALLERALITVLHNGVLVHHAQPLLGATAHRAVAEYAAHAGRLPIELQDHGDAVQYRNVWIRDLE